MPIIAAAAFRLSPDCCAGNAADDRAGDRASSTACRGAADDATNSATDNGSAKRILRRGGLWSDGGQCKQRYRSNRTNHVGSPEPLFRHHV
jgi:hypothetical protein